MAEQKLDVRVSESGTAQVVSSLDKLEKQLKAVENAQQAETATAEKSLAVLGRMNDGLSKFFERTSSKMAVIEKAAGLLGKFNLAFELVNKAIAAGQYVINNYILKVKSLEPALDGVNRKLASQIDLLKKIAGAGAELASAAGLEESQLTPAELQSARSLKAQENELLARQQKLLGEIEAAQSRVNRQQAAVGNAGGSVVMGEDFEKTAKDLERVGFALEDIRLKREKMIADARQRERGSGAAPRAEDGGGGGGGGGGGAIESLTGEGQQQGATEAFTGGAVVQQMGQVVSTTVAMNQQLDSTAEAWKNLGESALQAGADMRRTAAVAVASAILQGKSIAKMVGMALKAKSQDYFVESLDWGLKAAGFAIFGSPQAGAAAAISVGYLAASGVAAGAAALLGGGGGGSRGGGGGGGTAPAVGATGPRALPDEGAGGPLTVNVTIDGLAISTADDIANRVADVLGHGARTPGTRSRMRRALEEMSR